MKQQFEFKWMDGPPPSADVYVTRRGFSKYQTKRYWDGECWWQIEPNGSRGGKPFTWPKKSRIKRPTFTSMTLRSINIQSVIQWGEPYRVFSDAEVLAYLVKRGVLQPGWRDHYQNQMRENLAKGLK